MSTKKRFTVTNPPIIIKLTSILILFFGGGMTINTIVSGPLHPALYISALVIVIIPCTAALLWAALFKITVDGETITVRRGNGFKYSFHVSEIVRVDRKIVDTGMGINEKTIIKTAKRKVAIGTLMRNADKMVKYLLENVDDNKITK